MADGTFSKDFGEMSAPGIDWFVEIPAGRQVVFVLEDASGEWTSGESHCSTAAPADTDRPRDYT